MSKIMEPILQFFALGIFATVALLSMPFWLLSVFYVKGDEKRVSTTEGITMRLLYSEAVWGCIALVACVSLVVVLLRS
jgi:hypothetical protein